MGTGAERSRSHGRLELRPEQLRRRLDPSRLHFESTEDVEPLVGTIGQPRALDALEYGLAVETRGFNLFVSGLPGSGRLTTVLDYLGALAAAKPAPSDWIYVNDFGNPDRPNAISMPAGRGTEFARAMEEFVEAARREIPRAFESEEYDRRQREIVAEIAQERESEEEELTRYAAERGIALKTTLVGVASVPLVDGKPITREHFEQLPEEQRVADHEGHERGRGASGRLHPPGSPAREGGGSPRAGARAGGRALRDGAALPRARGALRGPPGVLAYLDDVKRDVLASLGDFRDGEETPARPSRSRHRATGLRSLQRQRPRRQRGGRGGADRRRAEPDLLQPGRPHRVPGLLRGDGHGLPRDQAGRAPPRERRLPRPRRRSTCSVTRSRGTR